MSDMADVLFVLLTVAVFAVAALVLRAVERL
ncbi:potassium-transporting ATPase [Planosporangium thailandense]|uniref:Potassium-transporting ATPase n=1 Tax=Planosporangium thailandense TaxID=765197 RepID=A0ABX0Y218_9ACTN|nr:potassium-transporting ATPase [Planosporangium thailandense]